MYHIFIEFLKNSVISTILEDSFIKSFVSSQKGGSEANNQDMIGNLQTILNVDEENKAFEEGNQKRQFNIKSSSNNKALSWMEEFIEILLLLE